jgi:hypothetical protein
LQLRPKIDRVPHRAAATFHVEVIPMADDQRPPAPAPQHAGDANSPKINLNDTVGAILLGLVAILLAFALWRAQARRRELEKLLLRHALAGK